MVWNNTYINYMRDTKLTRSELAGIGAAIVHKGHEKFWSDPATQNGITALSWIVPMIRGAIWISTGARIVLGTMAAKEGQYLVYKGLDAAGKTRYVGITSREPAIRFAEHAASGTAKAGLTYKPIATGLSKIDARIWEQTLINQYGLSKNGGMLYNHINSIAPKYWWQYGINP
jgi:hypothetical protein